MSFSSGPITRLRAKSFKEALNGLVQEIWADSRKTKMGSNSNQGLVHVIKAIEEANLLSSKDIKWEDVLVLPGHVNSSHLAIFEVLEN